MTASKSLQCPDNPYYLRRKSIQFTNKTTKKTHGKNNKTLNIKLSTNRDNKDVQDKVTNLWLLVLSWVSCISLLIIPL